MSERHFFGKDSMSSISKEQTGQRREIELTKEQMELQRAMRSSVFSWMERLVTAPKPPFWKPLSRSRDYGAAFLPAALATIFVGCADGTVVECTSEERDMIETVRDWVVEHPEEIQTHMELIWPASKSETTADAIANTLAAVNLECAVFTNEKFDAKLVGAWVMRPDIGQKTIYVNLANSGFDLSVDDFQAGEQAGLSIFDIDPGALTFEQALDQLEYQDYIYAVGRYAGTLFHEAAHFELGGHSKEANERAVEMVSSGENANEIDEVYAWGNAAEDLVIEKYFLDLPHNGSTEAGK